MKIPSLLTTAKCIPAAICGLLVVTWVLSGYYAFGAIYRWPNGIDGRGHIALGCEYSTLHYFHDRNGEEEPQIVVRSRPADATLRLSRRWLGVFVIESPPTPRHTVFRFPVPWLVTLAVPLALGPFVRFPLRSWFAWTALIALELVLYSRFS